MVQNPLALTICFQRHTLFTQLHSDAPGVSPGARQEKHNKASDFADTEYILVYKIYLQSWKKNEG